MGRNQCPKMCFEQRLCVDYLYNLWPKILDTAREKTLGKKCLGVECTFNADLINIQIDFEDLYFTKLSFWVSFIDFYLQGNLYNKSQIQTKKTCYSINFIRLCNILIYSHMKSIYLKPNYLVNLTFISLIKKMYEIRHQYQMITKFKTKQIINFDDGCM